jgi:hypothetical protein
MCSSTSSFTEYVMTKFKLEGTITVTPEGGEPLEIPIQVTSKDLYQFGFNVTKVAVILIESVEDAMDAILDSMVEKTDKKKVAN